MRLKISNRFLRELLAALNVFMFVMISFPFSFSSISSVAYLHFFHNSISLKGNFVRIYPTDDKVKAAKYQRLAETAAKVFTGTFFQSSLRFLF